MGNMNIQQHKFIVKAGMTAEDVKNSKEATALQKKYASAFDTDRQKGFSQKEADLFNATTFSEKADGTVTFWTRQKDGTKKGTKFDSNDKNIQFKSDDEVKPYVKKVAVKRAAPKKEESVSFFDERWSGHMIAKLTGDNFITDWLQNKDKVCTDGKDDGEIGLWEGTKCFLNGLIGGIPKAMINHPVATAVAIGVGAAAVSLTSGAILPVLGAAGIVMGVGMAGYGGYKALTAKTDGAKKQALETLGLGVTTTVLSAAAADKALEKAADAGVKSAQVSKDANFIDKTIQMFKAIPECLTKSKEWASYKLFGTAITVERPNGTIQTLEKGNLVEETLADGTIRKYSDKIEGLVVEEKLPDGTYNITSKSARYHSDLSEHVSYKISDSSGSYTKVTARDGSYKIIDNNAGVVVEEKFPDGTFTCKETHSYHSDLSEHVSYKISDSSGSYTKVTARDGSYKIINDDTGVVVEESLTDGGYKLYDSNGNFTKGEIVNGNKTSFFEGDKLVSSREQLPNGGYKLYDANGNFTEGKIIDGNKTSFFEGGKLVSSREQLPNGGYKLYDANGNFTEGQIVDGNKTSFFEGGKLVSSREQLPNGGYKLYDANGNFTEGQIVDGNKTSFFEGGKLVSTREKLPNGDYKILDASGRIERTIKYNRWGYEVYDSKGIRRESYCGDMTTYYDENGLETYSHNSHSGVTCYYEKGELVKRDGGSSGSYSSGETTVSYTSDGRKRTFDPVHQSYTTEQPAEKSSFWDFVDKGWSKAGSSHGGYISHHLHN